MIQFTHVLFTRFNVPSGGKEVKIRLKDDWLEKRFRLFEIFCLPSIEQQSNKNFLWLIYFDQETPALYKDKVLEYCARCPQIRPVWVEEWNTQTVKSGFIDNVPENTKSILTTRLDNDDGLHRDFIETLQHSVSDYGYYNFPKGVVYRFGDAYSHTHMSNAFLSLLEEYEGFDGVWKHPHPEVIKKYKVKQLNLNDAWLQVIHDTNVSNKIRGRLLSSDTWTEGYPYLSSELVNENGFLKVAVIGNVKFLVTSLRDSLFSVIRGAVKR